MRNIGERKAGKGGSIVRIGGKRKREREVCWELWEIGGQRKEKEGSIVGNRREENRERV